VKGTLRKASALSLKPAKPKRTLRIRFVFTDFEEGALTVGGNYDRPALSVSTTVARWAVSSVKNDHRHKSSVKIVLTTVGDYAPTIGFS
jgi:hypothetical protein